MATTHCRACTATIVECGRRVPSSAVRCVGAIIIRMVIYKQWEEGGAVYTVACIWWRNEPDSQAPRAGRQAIGGKHASKQAWQKPSSRSIHSTRS